MYRHKLSALSAQHIGYFRGLQAILCSGHLTADVWGQQANGRSVWREWCSTGATRGLFGGFKAKDAGEVAAERRRIKEEMGKGYFDDVRKLREDGGKREVASGKLTPVNKSPLLPPLLGYTGGLRTVHKHLPADICHSAATLLCVGMRASAKPMLESWMRPFGDHFSNNPEVKVYELSLVDSWLLSLWPLRSLLVKTMTPSSTTHRPPSAGKILASKIVAGATALPSPSLAGVPPLHPSHPSPSAGGHGSAAASDGGGSNNGGAVASLLCPGTGATLPVEIIYSFGDMTYIREKLGIANRLVGYVYLLDHEGRVRWGGSGTALEVEVKSLLACTEELLREQRNQELEVQADAAYHR